MPGIIFWVIITLISIFMGIAGYVVARYVLRIRTYNYRILAGPVLALLAAVVITQPFNEQAKIVVVLVATIIGGISAYLTHQITHQRRYE